MLVFGRGVEVRLEARKEVVIGSEQKWKARLTSATAQLSHVYWVTAGVA